MKLCKIKWRYSVFTSDRALTRANTDLAFLGLRESFNPPFFQHFSGSSESPGWLCWGHECWCGSQHVSKVATPALWWAVVRMWGGAASAAFRFLVPWTLFYLCDSFGEGPGSFRSVCELLKRHAVCLNVCWAYGLLIYSDLCALYSVSKELFWWCIFCYWGNLIFS